MPRWTQDEYAEYQRRRAGNHKANSVPSRAEPERNPSDEPMAAKAGKGPDPVRHAICIKSFRVRLCDERNLYDKHFTDSLVYAGAISGDSPKEIEIQVSQHKVESTALERTEITVTPL